MARAKKKKEEPKQRIITRKIFFYRVNAGVETDTGEPRKVNFGPAIKHLTGLPFTTDGRYLDTDDGKQLCCWPDNLQLPYRLRLANIRRGQHPPVENEGTFSPLVLGAGRGLGRSLTLSFSLTASAGRSSIFMDLEPPNSLSILLSN